MSLGYYGRNKTVTLTSTPQIIADYNLHRHGLFIFNDVGANCKVAFGFDPAPEDYFQLGEGNKLELDSLVPTGPVWATGTGPLHLLDNAMVGNTVGWTPKDLLPEFTDGKALWYDLSDASTVFEDTAATVHATVGGEIGMILDKSVNGMHLTFVGGDKPIWNGKSAVFTKNAKFVLPGFVDASWVYNASSGTTYYAVGLTPVKVATNQRPILFQFGSLYGGDTGATLAYDMGSYGSSTSPHWRDTFNGAVAWTPKPFPAITFDQPVVLGVKSNFTSQVVGSTTLIRNLIEMHTVAFNPASKDINTPRHGTSFFSPFLDNVTDGFRGEFHGLFIRHQDVVEEDDLVKLQRWMATKLGIEV